MARMTRRVRRHGSDHVAEKKRRTCHKQSLGGRGRCRRSTKGMGNCQAHLVRIQGMNSRLPSTLLWPPCHWVPPPRPLSTVSPSYSPTHPSSRQPGLLMSACAADTGSQQESSVCSMYSNSHSNVLTFLKTFLLCGVAEPLPQIEFQVSVRSVQVYLLSKTLLAFQKLFLVHEIPV